MSRRKKKQIVDNENGISQTHHPSNAKSAHNEKSQ